MFLFRGISLAECHIYLLSETQLDKWRTYGITLQQRGKKRVAFFSVGPLVTFVMSVSEWNFTALTSYTVTPTLCSSRVSFHRKWISATQSETGQLLMVQWNKSELKHENSRNHILCSLIIVKIFWWIFSIVWSKLYIHNFSKPICASILTWRMLIL